jgi:two-component system response regulator RpfG
MSKILIVDDQPSSLRILTQYARTLDGVASVIPCDDPNAALNWARENEPDLVLVDYRMPAMNGVDFIVKFRRLPACADVPLIVVTASHDRIVKCWALEAGAWDFLIKPVDRLEFRARSRNLLMLRQQQQIIKQKASRLEKRVDQATREIRTREYETLLRLAKAGEYRDEETGNHVMRMARYSRLVAQTLGLPRQECETIEVAAPMHDIGKIGIPDEILLKPDKLSEREFEAMKTHTLIGYEILKGSPSRFLQRGAEIALGHHERFDGTGYPHGISGAAIPLAARIVAVADVFDALTSERSYKSAWSLADAFDYLREQAGNHFDPGCVASFLRNANEVVDIHRAFSDVPPLLQRSGAT